jgi:hypothetical protein
MTNPNTNPLIAQAIDGIMHTISKRFDLVWQRPDVAEIVQGFIGGEIAFLVVDDAIILAKTGEATVPRGSDWPIHRDPPKPPSDRSTED